MNITDYETKFESVYCKHTNAITEGMIQFDEDTANWLAGPFMGNYAYYMIQDCSNWRLMNESQERQKIRLSYYLIPGWRRPAQNEEQLQKRLAILTEKERKLWQQNQDNHKLNTPTIENPIRFYLCGNDDVSYTKFFPNIETAKKEEELFLSMEPINYHLHINENNFVFTN